MSTDIRIDVIIPSVGRPADAIKAIRSAQRARENLAGRAIVGEIFVVHRDSDSATRDAAIKAGAQAITTELPGLAAAMRAGAAASTADVVAFMDDDARMRPDWYAHILRHYADPHVGGVGGVDAQADGYPVRINQSLIGQIDRWGRVLGGHHQANGAARPVAHLKGANCSFRRHEFLSLNFQESIAGTGAQARNEFVASMLVASRGMRLVLEPAAIVDHHPAPRSSGDDRSDPAKAYETAHNETLGFVLSDHPRRRQNSLFLALVGYNNTPGLVRLMLRRADWSSVRATFDGVRDGRRAAKDARLQDKGTAS